MMAGVSLVLEKASILGLLFSRKISACVELEGRARLRVGVLIDLMDYS